MILKRSGKFTAIGAVISPINDQTLSIFDHRQPHLPQFAQIALFDSRAPRYDSGDYWVRQHSSQGKIYITIGSEKHNTSKVFCFDPKTVKLEKLLKEDLISAVFFKTRLIECGKQSDPLVFPLSIKIYDLETKKLIKEYSDCRGQWSLSLNEEKGQIVASSGINRIRFDIPL